MTAKLGQQHYVLLSDSACGKPIQNLLVAVPDNPANRFIKASLVLNTPKAIDKHEIRITVNPNVAGNTMQHLIVPFLNERFFYCLGHWNLSAAGCCFGSVDSEVASPNPVIIINQGVVDVNQSILQINVLPSIATIKKRVTLDSGYITESGDE